MGLLGSACTREKVVQHVEIAFTRGDIRYPASLQPMVQQLRTNEEGVRGRGRVVLEFVEEAGLGGRRCRGRLGGGERVEDVGGKGDLGGEGSRGSVEERGQEVGSNRGFPRARFTAVEKLAFKPRPVQDLGDAIQKENCLVFRAMPHPEKGPLGLVLGGGHGRRVPRAIALGRARVCVDAN